MWKARDASFDTTGEAAEVSVGEDMTKQSMKDECDINRIMNRFIKTGTVDHLNTYGASYGFVDSQTFHEAMNIVRTAEEMFDALPGEVREKFKNDPAEFLTFVQDEKNLPEMRLMGLAHPERTREVVDVRVLDSEADPTASSGAAAPPAGPQAGGARAKAERPAQSST